MGARLNLLKKPTSTRRFDPEVFLSTPGPAGNALHYKTNEAIFLQGDRCDAVFYIQKGRVKLSIISNQGREVIVAILGQRDFLAESCLTGQKVHLATATSMESTSVLKIGKNTMQRALRQEPALAGRFIAYLLSRNLRIEGDLVDQLFNSTEKRLARTLLLLARYDVGGKHEVIVPNITQETLAKMLGVSRERVNFFMTKFRKLGFIEYNGGIQVHNSLMSAVLHD